MNIDIKPEAVLPEDFEARVIKEAQKSKQTKNIFELIMNAIFNVLEVLMVTIAVIVKKGRSDS